MFPSNRDPLVRSMLVSTRGTQLQLEVQGIADSRRARFQHNMFVLASTCFRVFKIEARIGHERGIAITPGKDNHH